MSSTATTVPVTRSSPWIGRPIAWRPLSTDGSESARSSALTWRADSVCTYVTETLPITGSAKGATGWIRVTDATVFYDHPVHALADHTLNIDLRRPVDG